MSSWIHFVLGGVATLVGARLAGFRFHPGEILFWGGVVVGVGFAGRAWGLWASVPLALFAVFFGLRESRWWWDRTQPKG